MTRILNILRTPGAMLAALVLALAAQLEHTAQVFSMVVGATGIQAQLHAYAFAVAVETAVLLFVLAGHKWISYGFAIATALTNLSYYAMNGINLFSIAALPAWLMSLLLPAAIVGYSHTIAEQDTNTHPVHPQTLVAFPSVTTGHSEHTPTSTEATDNGIHEDVATRSAAAVAPALSAASLGTPQSASATPAKKAERKAAPMARKAKRGVKPTPEQRRAQIASSGMDDAGAIAAQFDVSVRTAQADLNAIRQATMQTNGVHA